MKLFKWIKQIFNPEAEVIEPFPELKKETTTAVVIKPTKPRTRKPTKSKSTGGKKNG